LDLDEKFVHTPVPQYDQPPDQPGESFHMTPSEQFVVVPGTSNGSSEGIPRSLRAPMDTSENRSSTPSSEPSHVGPSDVELASPRWEDHVSGQSIAPESMANSSELTDETCGPRNGQ
jgi:hypothetical protein